MSWLHLPPVLVIAGSFRVSLVNWKRWSIVFWELPWYFYDKLAHFTLQSLVGICLHRMASWRHMILRHTYGPAVVTFQVFFNFAAGRIFSRCYTKCLYFSHHVFLCFSHFTLQMVKLLTCLFSGCYTKCLDFTGQILQYFSFLLRSRHSIKYWCCSCCTPWNPPSFILYNGIIWALLNVSGLS